jgi:hypothetical protein
MVGVNINILAKQGLTKKTQNRYIKNRAKLLYLHNTRQIGG